MNKDKKHIQVALESKLYKSVKIKMVKDDETWQSLLIRLLTKHANEKC